MVNIRDDKLNFQFCGVPIFYIFQIFQMINSIFTFQEYQFQITLRQTWNDQRLSFRRKLPLSHQGDLLHQIFISHLNILCFCYAIVNDLVEQVTSQVCCISIFVPFLLKRWQSPQMRHITHNRHRQFSKFRTIQDKWTYLHRCNRLIQSMYFDFRPNSLPDNDRRK